MDGWIVARTQPRREGWACENLLRQDAEVYVPMLAPPPQKRNGHTSKPKCLFPSYVFVRKTNGQWRFLLGTFGIIGVVMQGGRPAILPDREICRMKAMEGPDGLVQLPSHKNGKFAVGDQVRVAKGLFSGYVGIYQGSGPQARLKVLLDYLGRKTSVLIAEKDLEDA